MRTVPYVTVDVFTRERFGGNPLAVVTDARGLTTAQMQALAAEFNYSETTFVLPPDNSAHTARVRIFNRTQEMPFAGHPNVGTAFILAGMGLDKKGVLLFEELAGLVEVQVERDAGGAVTEAVIAAPQPLSLGPELPVDRVAACLGLDLDEVLVSAHRPVVASVGVTFAVAEVVATAVSRAAPNVDAFRHLRAARAAELEGRLSLFCYAGPSSGEDSRANVRAPGRHLGRPCDGQRGAALAALLLSLGSDETLSLDIVQGAEMGRPSRICAAARRRPDGIHATVRGGCVPVFRGEALV